MPQIMSLSTVIPIPKGKHTNIQNLSVTVVLQ